MSRRTPSMARTRSCLTESPSMPRISEASSLLTSGETGYLGTSGRTFSTRLRAASLILLPSLFGHTALDLQLKATTCCSISPTTASCISRS